MKISSRDKTLLIILAVVCVVALYYFLLISPLEKKAAELNTNYDLKLAERSEIDLKLMSEPNLDLQIKNLEKTVLDNSESFYGDLRQEEALMTVFELSKGLEFRLNDLTFADMKIEGSNQEKYLATMNFIGNFDAFHQYLKNIQSYNKKLVIKEISILNNYEETLTGKVALEFNGFPQVKDYLKSDNQLVSNQFIARTDTSGLFTPFEGFTPTDVMVVDESDYTDYNSTIDTNSIDYETYKPKTQIYGFEDGSNFFVGNTVDILGSVSRSKTAIAGGYAAEVSFDFVTGREFSEANVVFDTNPVMINKQADFLGLWVYSYEASNHAIGAVIIDSKGKEYRVELAPEVNWTQWQELEASMPVEISYPCMIQRIYVEGIGYEQKLTGKYLFDKLEVSYPVQ